MRLCLAFACALAAFGAPRVGAAERCRIVEVDMIPSDDLQIVVWIETADGNYVDTAFITQLTGRYGLGNRPGIMEFNSGPRWPYGRRLSTFPVWAHRHGLSWPQVVFQDGDDSDLSHPIIESSPESFYCRPILPNEELWDAETCASTVFTDKGALSGESLSQYPPRSDLVPDERDHNTVGMMSALNPFDAVSRATPQGGMSHVVRWSLPTSLPDGDYVAWVEVSKEFDQNESYSYPAPVGIPWSEYGAAYRGQPSLLYRLDVRVAEGVHKTTAIDYVGYGDPEGRDGEVRPPDSTIVTGVPGSGASRLLVTHDGQDDFRVKVVSRVFEDAVAPGLAQDLRVIEVAEGGATLGFVAPGDDDDQGIVASYEVRYRAGSAITDENFSESTLASVIVEPKEPGSLHQIAISGLLPNTNYSVGVRALDECLNAGPVSVATVVTPSPVPDAVDACFVATASYGSFLAPQITALRRFRDRFLRPTIPGEALVEAYYTFGPALADFIEPSPLLRHLARAILAPVVEMAAQ